MKLISKANKTNRLAKTESDYNYDNKFYRDFPNFKTRSLESKYDNINKFYKALNEFKKRKAITDETEKRKRRVANNTVALYNNYFDSYGKSYTENVLNEKEWRNPGQFEIADNELPEWLESRNDFNKAKRMIDGIRNDMNKVKASKEDKKVLMI